jgi:flavin-dependent dehydrogenase
VGPEEVCVALITRERGVRLEDAFHGFPQIMKHLGGAAPTTRQQGAISITQSLPTVYRGSRVLVGEASGSVDAITGDGLSMAFQHAQALAAALKEGELSHYQRAHRRIARLPRRMARLMLLMDGNQWIRGRALRALAAEPTLFSRMLAVHTGALPPAAFGLQGTLALGWHLITT